MAKDLSQMDTTELMRESVKAQRRTSLFAFGAFLAVAVAAIYVIICAHSVVPKINAAADTVASLQKPVDAMVEKVDELDIQAFNEAVGQMKNVFAGFSGFFGN